MIYAMAALMVVLSAIFSGLETGMYRLSRLRLRLAHEKGQRAPRILSKTLRDGPGLLLTLIVANNLVNYLATGSITYVLLALVTSEHLAELLTTLVVAPLLFVFAESLPKNLFLYRANSLMAFFAPLLYVTHRALTWCGIVPLLKFLSQRVGRTKGDSGSSKTMITSTQRHQVRALLRETHEEGILSPVQTDIIDRIVNISALRLNAVMVPLNQVQSVSVESDREALLGVLKKHALTRLLVWSETATNVVGAINIYDVLETEAPFTNLGNFVSPIRRMKADTPVIDAIDIMRREELRIVLVTRSKRGGLEVPVGIVTMKDLVEELLGELAEW